MNELSALVDMTPRTIRFYIQEGLVERPLGQNRGAYYTDRHLRQLMTVKKYRDMGVSLERIAQILNEEDRDYSEPKFKSGVLEVISRIHLMDGVELSINPEKSGLSSADIRELSKAIIKFIESKREEKKR